MWIAYDSISGKAHRGDYLTEHARGKTPTKIFLLTSYLIVDHYLTYFFCVKVHYYIMMFRHHPNQVIVIGNLILMKINEGINAPFSTINFFKF